MASNFITLELDDDDYATIMAEVELRRAQDAENGGESTMPDGDSDEIGAVIAEVIRDLDDYRSLHSKEHPPRAESA